GWNRGDTLNLNIRYGQMTMAPIAQAAIHGLRQRLGPPFSAYFATIRSLIPAPFDHRFRKHSATESGAIRSPISESFGHRFRSDPITRFGLIRSAAGAKRDAG
ncbi:MAG: hypothetical protein M1457_09990, partial [bacterium]|nr:hypothetical protein [bacterium]